jgi:hypothetical protein
MYSFLTPQNIVEIYKTSRQYTESLTQNTFFEYERIARNKPHASIPKEYPKTTDGTTASIIRKTPHRVVQQLPTGNVHSDREDWLAIVASFIYTNKIIPHANEGYALLQKCWSVIERFLTFGYCPTYAPFVEHGGSFSTDLRLPYWGDISVQPGKLSDDDSNYLFMRSWWQTKDIEALIASQSKLSKDNQTWDTTALAKVKDFMTTKEVTAQTPIEREKAINTKGGVELITGFQRGKNAKFYTFHVQSDTIVRTKVNKDPRGELPISFAYGDIDGSNPFGRSIIDLVGGLQNLMDGEMQMYQYNRALQLNPPLIKRGNFNKNKVKFAPNIIIDVGSDPNATVEPLQIDTKALENFPNNYGLMKSQLLNLLASPDTSIGAQSGNPGFSKTPQGVLAGQANLSVDDNYVRKQFERWFERWSETAINLYFAERTGIEELQLDDETAQTLRGLEDFFPGGPQLDGNVLPPGKMVGTLSDDNKIRINYDTATPALQFKVNASSSQKKDDIQQLQIQQGLLDTVMKYPILNKKWGGVIDTDEIARAMVESSNINNPELIAPDMTQAEKAAKKQAQQQPNGFSPLFDKPKITIDYRDVESPTSRAKLLQLAGAAPNQDETLPPLAPGIAEQAARGTATLSPDEAPGQGAGQPATNPIDLGDIYKQTTDPNVKAEIEGLAGLHPNPGGASTPTEDPPAGQVTTDHLLKAHQQAHTQEMDKAKLLLEVAKTQQASEQHAAQLKAAAKQPAAPKVKK